MLIMYQKYDLACICIHYHAIKFWHKRKGSEELTSDPFSVPGAGIEPARFPTSV